MNDDDDDDDRNKRYYKSMVLEGPFILGSAEALKSFIAVQTAAQAALYKLKVDKAP